jgi:NAD(P)H-hydrate epimerase
MEKFDASSLKRLYRPAPDSHKGQNGKVMIIGGSILFHSGSIWPLEVASKIVDMVYYSSVDENNEIVKAKFQNGIVVPRSKIDDYISEADSVLIGPGLPRPDGEEEGDDNTKNLTQDLFAKYPDKKWVVDGGSLQTVDPASLPKNAIVTPHHKEFETLFGVSGNAQTASEMAKKFDIIVLLKGPIDIVSNGTQTVEIEGGNAGMTKGGTGDVLAGLTASLYAKNDAFLSACAASYINKKAGESLEKRVGLNFNATDLLNEIPVVLKEIL